MKSYLSNVIPELQKFSKELDDKTKLLNQHWVSIDDVESVKKVFIFQSSNRLLISQNGKVENGRWEYLGSKSLLINTSEGQFLLKHAFFDENIIALKIDGANEYLFFVNETKYSQEINTKEAVIKFLSDTYLNKGRKSEKLPKKTTRTVNAVRVDKDDEIEILRVIDKFSLTWGFYRRIEITNRKGWIGVIYFGDTSGQYFYYKAGFGRIYCDNLDDTIQKFCFT